MNSPYDSLGTDCSPAIFAIATRVAQEFYGAVQDPRTAEENLIGSGLPGDTHGRLADPEPFKGRNLSRNPHPKISPQTMPATIERPFSGTQMGAAALKLTTDFKQSPEVFWSDESPRHAPRHSTSLRKLVGK